MNIFVLHHNPKLAAQYHCDKHVVKMILEYCQLLSTAHRVLDGQVIAGKSKTGRKQTLYKIGDDRDDVLYKATHVNHPSAIWARESLENYQWLHELLVHLCREYTKRYDKVHKCQMTGLVDLLGRAPAGISRIGITPFALAMPDDCKTGNAVESYRMLYNTHKAKIAKWKNTEPPDWFNP